MKGQTFHATDDDAGLRLDRFLARQMPEISRARVQELIAAGSVLIDGTSVKGSHRMRGGEDVHIAATIPRPAIKAEPEDIPLELILDDPDFAVVNKPAGMSVHAGAGSLERNRGTLVNAILHRFQQLSSGGDELRPGIVHRLDRETSGLVIVAKTDFAHQRLAEQFQKRTVRKRYLALVYGRVVPESGTVDYRIARDPVHRKRMRAIKDPASTLGRSAITHWRVRESLSSRFGDFSLLDLTIETGRTHQIRVHMAALRHPVVGDKLYGGTPSALLPPLERNFLHAAELEFLHPRTGAPVHCTAPLAPELEVWLGRLRADGNP